MTPAQVLIVDDEEAIRASLEELLVRDGHRMAAADSGERALELIARQQFDLILLDLRMPGIGGLEVLVAVREQALDTAVIVLTGYGSMDTAIEALRQGAHDYLLKPCDATTLRESVRTALLKREREKRQRDLLIQVAQSLTASLEEIQAAVVQPPAGQQPAAEAMAVETQGLSQGGLVVDLARHVITLEGNELDLSPTEFRLLACLAQEVPKVVSAQELVRQVHGENCDRLEASEIVRHHVYRIREKARGCAGRQDIVRTVRGVGYALSGPVRIA